MGKVKTKYRVSKMSYVFTLSSLYSYYVFGSIAGEGYIFVKSED